MSTAMPADPILRDAITFMHEINRRLRAGRLTALRLAWLASSTRVLDGDICAALAPVDSAP